MISVLPSFDLSILPKEVPIFDLSGAVLLPRTLLPLTVEDKKFKVLVEDALKKDRLVGVVQKESQNQIKNKIFRSGCLGKITSFTELETEKYFIAISGLVRFTILKELKPKNNYRRVKVSYEPFAFDLTHQEYILAERKTFLELLKKYLILYDDIVPNWNEISAIPDERLIASLVIMCPFEPCERQALLESPTLADRCRMMMSLFEMSLLRGAGVSWVKH